MRRNWLLFLGLAPYLGGEAAWAENAPHDDVLDKYAYLRRLTLDLAGTVPSVDAYAGLEAVDDVPEDVIDRLLSSDQFVARVVRRHRSLLWNNIDYVTLTDHRGAFARARGRDGSVRYWRRRVAVTYRGEVVPCDDRPAAFDARGAIQHRVDEDGFRREGTVMVAPYWNPDTVIKVCAYDAQTRARSSSGIDCATPAGFEDPGCGCGPRLRLCRHGSNLPVTRSLAEDVDRRVARMIRDGLPYLELFTGRTAFVNGPIVHYLRYQTRVPGSVRMTPTSYDLQALPDLEWASGTNTWKAVRLGPEHAGVLTAPAYLLRFQTNRARANRFYETFLCRPFTAPPKTPANAAPPKTPANAAPPEPHPDLQERFDCRECHALLDPAAAYWGRWIQEGAGFLSPGRFPAARPDCRQCAREGRSCGDDCVPHYLTEVTTPFEEPYAGALRALRFLKEPHRPHVERGPARLVARTTGDERFAECAVRRAFEGMLGRPLTPVEEAGLGGFGRQFRASGYDYRALTKAIVTSALYRTVRR